MRPLIVVITEGAHSFARRKLHGAAGSLEAAEALLAHTLAIAKEIGDVHVCTPAGSDAVTLAERHDIPWIRQAGGSLGDRIAAVLRLVGIAARSRPVIILGDDCPSLTSKDLADAALALERGSPSVVGRAKDGGFWMLGLATVEAGFVSALSNRVAWCTPDAFATLSDLLLEHLGSRPTLLEERGDLDALEDVPAAVRETVDTRLRALLRGLHPELTAAEAPPVEAPLPVVAVSGPDRPRPPPRP